MKDKLNEKMYRIHAMLMMLCNYFDTPISDSLAQNKYALLRYIDDYNICLTIAIEELEYLENLINDKESEK